MLPIAHVNNFHHTNAISFPTFSILFTFQLLTTRIGDGRVASNVSGSISEHGLGDGSRA
jgi:hypothetical protein